MWPGMCGAFKLPLISKGLAVVVLLVLLGLDFFFFAISPLKSSYAIFNILLYFPCLVYHLTMQFHVGNNITKN